MIMHHLMLTYVAALNKLQETVDSKPKTMLALNTVRTRPFHGAGNQMKN